MSTPGSQAPRNLPPRRFAPATHRIARDERRRQITRIVSIVATVAGIALLIYVLSRTVGPGEFPTPTPVLAAGTSVPVLGTPTPASGTLVPAGTLAPTTERQLADQGQQHIPRGAPHPAYNSHPPTSGWHFANAAALGVHAEPIPLEEQVHNLEHGQVVVQYNCPDGCPDLVAQLTTIANRYPRQVLLAPLSDMPQRIALTAWTWIEELDEFDEARIVGFIERHADCGPELGRRPGCAPTPTPNPIAPTPEPTAAG